MDREQESWAALPADLQSQILKLYEDKYEMATFTGGLEDDMRQQRQLEAQECSLSSPTKEVEKYLANVPPSWPSGRSVSDPKPIIDAVINKVLVPITKLAVNRSSLTPSVFLK